MTGETPIAMSMEQLKSHAYDVLAQIEALQRELSATNEAIAAKMKEEQVKPEVKDEKKK